MTSSSDKLILVPNQPFQPQKIMPNSAPVALILFSNDLNRFLPAVERERKIIEEALEHFVDSNRLKVIARSAVSTEEIFRLFNRYRGRIVLFHFAGHAEGNGLQFNQNFEDNDLGRAVGLADLFHMEVENGMLQLVFLNGCSTHPQLELLKQAGIPSVISTRHPIEDKKAVLLAQQFYQCLANSEAEQPFENLPTLGDAFQHAIAFLKTSYSVAVQEQKRSLIFDFDGTREDQSDKHTWTLYSSQPDWQLSVEIADEQKPFNERLTLDLIEAIEPHSKAARKFLAKARTISGWEDIARVTDKAKDILSYSYVGVLGIQLRKLFAIGKEALSENKQRQYLLHCLLTARRSIQLLCFSLLSHLWDYQKEQSRQLSETERKDLQHFFDNQFDLDLQGYVELLGSLCQMCSRMQLEFPMAELETFQAQLEEESDWMQAVRRLQEIQARFDKSQCELSDCFVVERQLSQLLRSLHFLAAYRMVSIKTIAYDEMRNSPPRYLHTFTALGIDSKFNVNTERVNYVDAPITTDAILLFKGRYNQSINLFPFIIDVNALTFESGAKVCFYNGQDFNDNSLNYRFLEDNSLVNVAYTGIHKEDTNLNQLMMDPEQRKILKLDTVWQQFQEAKKTLLRSSSVEIDDLFGDEEEDDFGF